MQSLSEDVLLDVARRVQAQIERIERARAAYGPGVERVPLSVAVQRALEDMAVPQRDLFHFENWTTRADFARRLEEELVARATHAADLIEAEYARASAVQDQAAVASLADPGQR